MENNYGGEYLKTSKKYTCVILCGGKSLRTRFDLDGLNKLLAPINNTPLLHHVLNIYHSTHLFNKFILCLGNESDMLQESIINSSSYSSDQWRGVDLVMLETGHNVTATSRIRQSVQHINDDVFFLSYGDILSNFNLREMLEFHTRSRSEITIALVKAKMPYGKVLVDDSDRIYEFVEKPILEHWINAGCFIFNTNSIQNEDAGLELESELLPKFIEEYKKPMFGYKHNGYWKGIDTYKDFVEIRNEWETVRKTISLAVKKDVL